VEQYPGHWALVNADGVVDHGKRRSALLERVRRRKPYAPAAKLVWLTRKRPLFPF
jgi:hypothetical protein